MHIHVINGRNEAKFWLDDVSLARNQGLSKKEVQEALRLVAEHREEFINEWNRRKTIR